MTASKLNETKTPTADFSLLSSAGQLTLIYLAMRCREIELKAKKDTLWSPLIYEALELVLKQLSIGQQKVDFSDMADDAVVNKWLALHYIRYPDDKRIFDDLYMMVNKHWLDITKGTWWNPIVENALVPWLTIKNNGRPSLHWRLPWFGQRFSITVTW